MTSSPISSLRALTIAAIIAIAALFLFILPAERGYDPTGIGARLGLTALNGTTAAGAPGTLDDVTGGNETLTASTDSSGPLTLPNPAISQLETVAPKVETLKITLGLDEKTEIKAVLGKAKAIVYSWSTDGGKVYVDYHGHDPSKGDNYWVRYEEADGITGRSGSLVAPFSGEHGWFWLNVSDAPVTITLQVTGYQEKLVNYGLLQ
jgi:hypothetical protein